MLDQFSRTELLIGKDGIKKLENSKVCIFGIGGVGSYVVEGLVRAGIGNFILVDNDKISLTNLNRQIIATTKTIGKSKVLTAKNRIIEINPNAKVEVYEEFFMPESKDIFDNTVDYVIDCVDTVTAKIEIIMRAQKLNIPIISSMGTGNKLDPTKFEVTDIYKTEICPLAKVMRKELRNRGVKKLKVIYSKGKENISYPIVFLSNNNTASSSEILILALKEGCNAKIVGIQTYGKGVGQSIYTAKDYMYKFTSESWTSPSGISINGVGISPDIVVENSDENDLQLQKAKEYIKSLK